MLTVLSAGLPISAKDILSNAMNEVFNGAVDIQELTRETLRSRVRLSGRNVEIVLVILDSVSSDMCSDIENGLYSSDKYYTYTSDKGLADFLNGKYGLSIVVEDEVPEVSSEEEGYSISDDIIKEYEDKLLFKSSIIANLESRIKELQDFYGGDIEVPTDDIESIKEDLRSLESQLEISESKVKSSEETIDQQKATISSLEGKLKKVSNDYDSVLSELNDLQVIKSKQAGVLHDKEKKIEELLGIIKKLEESSEKIKELMDTVSRYKSEINRKDKEIGELRVDIGSKDRDIVRNSIELERLRSLQGTDDKLESANKVIESLNGDIAKVSSENTELLKRINELDSTITSLKTENESNLRRVSELELLNEQLSKRVDSDSVSLSTLNQEKFELLSKVAVLERNSGSADDNLINEIEELQRKLNEMSGNIFTKIGSSALPNSSLGCKLLSGNTRFKNIRFAFSGSAESRKGSYKCLLDEFRSNKDTKYLIVDLVSETSVDYVFEIKKLVPGMEWFRRGGSLHQYLSGTILKNTRVLSPGLGYVNDSYFLCIDWKRRLSELENSGYKVVMFCGDISNVIGRVLHESFASCGESIIYVVGNSIGSRTIVTNLRGLSNARDSIIAYYDYNKAIERFYNMVSKTNECKILSERNVSRR